MNSIINSLKTKNTLNPDIWINNDSEDINDVKLLPDVRTGVLKTAKMFVESFEVDGIEVEDVIIVGSITNYNWSEFSDIDIHVLIDTKKLGEDPDLLTQFFLAKKSIFGDKHDITIKGYEVELYVQSLEEELDSEGVFSALYNKWISKPNKKENYLDNNSSSKRAIIKKVKEFNEKFNQIKKINDMNLRIKELNKLREKIRKYRKSGLAENGELGIENLVFKYLRRSGLLDDISDLKIKSMDKLLTIKEYKI